MLQKGFYPDNPVPIDLQLVPLEMWSVHQAPTSSLSLKRIPKKLKPRITYLDVREGDRLVYESTGKVVQVNA